MPIWMKYTLIERPYYDPRSGEILESIEGRYNKPGIDPFVGGGKVYPDAIKLKCVYWREQGNNLLILLDEPQSKIDEIKSSAGEKEYAASPKVKRKYKLEDFNPIQLTNEEALIALKEMGLPQDTTLNSEGVPIVPSI